MLNKSLFSKNFSFGLPKLSKIRSEVKTLWVVDYPFRAWASERVDLSKIARRLVIANYD